MSSESEELFQELLGQNITIKDTKERQTSSGTYQYPVKVGQAGQPLDKGDKPWIVGTFLPKQYINPTHPEGHNGVDLKAPKGTPIFPIGPGEVIETGSNPKGGNYLKTFHAEDNLTAYYAHCEKVMAQKGQKITSQSVIALVGDSGNARGRGAHLHLEVKQDGRNLDPLQVIGKPIGSFSKEKLAVLHFKNLIKKYSYV